MPERHETEVHDEARKMFEEDRRAFQLSIEERRRQERATYIRLLASLGIAMGVVSATLIISFKVVDPTREGMFVNKAGLLERIEKTIQGGADLRAVRKVFNNRGKELLVWRMLLGLDCYK